MLRRRATQLDAAATWGHKAVVSILDHCRCPGRALQGRLVCMQCDTSQCALARLYAPVRGLATHRKQLHADVSGTANGLCAVSLFLHSFSKRDKMQPI